MSTATNMTQAESITKEQLRAAAKIINETMASDTRAMDGALLGAVLVALATNLSHLEVTDEMRNR